MTSIELKQALISMEASIDRFETHCNLIEKTDTDMAWRLFDDLRRTLKSLIKKTGDTQMKGAA